MPDTSSCAVKPTYVQVLSETYAKVDLARAGSNLLGDGDVFEDHDPSHLGHTRDNPSYHICTG